MTVVDQRGSFVIERAECLALLASAWKQGRIGRLGIALEGAPHIIPVNYSLVDHTIYVRLGPGLLASHLDGRLVAFEVDQAESGSKEDWSVLVRGLAELVPEDAGLGLGRDLPRPLVHRPGSELFSIRADVVTGRLIRHQDYEGLCLI